MEEFEQILNNLNVKLAGEQKMPRVEKVVESMILIINPPQNWKFGQVVVVDGTKAVVLSL